MIKVTNAITKVSGHKLIMAKIFPIQSPKWEIFSSAKEIKKEKEYAH